MNNKINVAAYLRYSSEQQREGYSIEAQTDAITNYCLSKNYNVVEWYIDEARSGTNADREEFQNAIHDAAKNKFEILIVHKLDRFARNRYDSIIYRQKLKESGVRLESVLERIDDDNPEDIILLSVLEGMNEYYSKNLSREVLKGIKAAALSGRSIGGATPFGLLVNKETRKLEPDPKYTIIINQIYDMYLSTGSIIEIVEWLESLDIKNKGRNIKKHGVRSILTNIKYTGTMAYFLNNRYQKNKPQLDPVIIENAFEAVVSKEKFDEVQRKLNSVSRGNYKRRRKQTYLLSGIMFGGEDKVKYVGRSMQKVKNGIYYNYSYYTRIVNGKSLDKFNKNEIEKRVFESIQEIVFSTEGLMSLKPKVESLLNKMQAPTPAESTAFKKEIRDVKNQLDNLLDLFLTDHISKNDYIKKKTALEERSLLYENELRKSAALNDFDVMDFIIAFKKIGELLTHEEYPDFRKQLINLIVERIDVFDERIVITYNLPVIGSEDSFIHKSDYGGPFILLCMNFERNNFLEGYFSNKEVKNVSINIV